jgi:hypothetical protein
MEQKELTAKQIAAINKLIESREGSVDELKDEIAGFLINYLRLVLYALPNDDCCCILQNRNSDPYVLTEIYRILKFG